MLVIASGMGEMDTRASILYENDRLIYENIIHDWILSPPIKEVTDLYKIHHTRLCRHVSDISRSLLHMFFELDIITEFSILYGAVVRKKEGEEEALYEELITWDTKYDIFAIQAILDDNCICANSRWWIGYAFHQLWPFLTQYADHSPGVYGWKDGQRVLHNYPLIPMVSRPLPGD